MRCYAFEGGGDLKYQCAEPGADRMTGGYRPFAVFMTWAFWILAPLITVVLLVLSKRKARRVPAVQVPLPSAAAPTTSVIVQLKLASAFGDESDLALRHELEDVFEHLLARSQNGGCDGGDIGNGAANIFCEVHDAAAAVDAIRSELTRRGIEGRAVIAISHGEDFEVVWPEGYQGQFSVL